MSSSVSPNQQQQRATTFGAKVFESLRVIQQTFKDEQSFWARCIRFLFVGLSLKNIWVRDPTFESYLRRFKNMFKHEISGTMIYDTLQEAGLASEEVWAPRSALYPRIIRFKARQTYLYFVEIEAGQVLSTFYSNREDFSDLTKWFWEQFGPYATVQVFSEKFFRKKARLAKLPASHGGTYIGKHSPERIVRYWKAYQKNGFTRSLLFAGAPGSGKTTVALKCANLLNGKVLHVPSDVFTEIWNPTIIEQIMLLLKPDILLLEDLHAIPEYYTDKLLHVLEWLPGAIGTDTLFIATTNKLKELADAIKRPGRFDDVYIFDAPDLEERHEILQEYCNQLGVDVSIVINNLDFFLEKTEGLTPTFLRELIISDKALAGEEGGLEYLKERAILMKLLAPAPLELGTEEEDAADAATNSPVQVAKNASAKLKKYLTDKTA